MAAPLRDGDGRTIAALNVTVHAAETPVEVLTGEYLPFGLVPTWRCRVASKEKKFSRSAASWVWRSAQKLSPGLLQRAEPVLMGDRVLDDERLEPLGMRDHESESHRAAVVLRDKGVPGQLQSLGETADDTARWSKVYANSVWLGARCARTRDSPVRRGGTGW